MNSIQRYLVAIFGLAFVVFIVWYFSAIVSYLLISVVLSFIGRPLVDWLRKIKLGRFKVSNALAAGITLFCMWAVFILFFYLFVPLIVSEFNSLRDIDYTQAAERLVEPVDKAKELLATFMGEDAEDLPAVITERVKEVFDTQNVKEAFGSVASVFSGLAVALFCITFITFFFLKDNNLFVEGLMVFIPSSYSEHVKEAFASIKKLLVRYFIGITLEVTLVFTLDSLGLWIIGLEFRDAVVIGLIAGLFNVIPYIGPLMGAITGLFIGLVNHLHLDIYTELLPLLGLMALVFALVQLLDNLVFQPVIYSNSVYAHPLEIFLVILIAGSLAGIVGMILAVPAYTILRVVAREFFAQYELVNNLTRGMTDEYD